MYTKAQKYLPEYYCQELSKEQRISPCAMCSHLGGWWHNCDCKAFLGNCGTLFTFFLLHLSCPVALLWSYSVLPQLIERPERNGCNIGFLEMLVFKKTLWKPQNHDKAFTVVKPARGIIHPIINTVTGSSNDWGEKNYSSNCQRLPAKQLVITSLLEWWKRMWFWKVFLGNKNFIQSIAPNLVLFLCMTEKYVVDLCCKEDPQKQNESSQVRDPLLTVQNIGINQSSSATPNTAGCSE